MLDPRRLVTLQAVLRTGSFAAAAGELGYTQAAVSQHIAELERSAGLKLLERRPARPTEAGLIALRAADASREAIAAAATELRALRDGHAGTLRLGAFASAAAAIAAPALADFVAAHPAIDPTLVQIETPEAHQALIDGRLDLAVTLEYDVAPHEPPAAIVRIRLCDDPLLAALPAGHPLARCKTIELRRLAAERWIASPLAGVPLAALRAAADASPQRTSGGSPFRQSARFEGDDFATVLSLVACGLGVALMPRLALAAVPDTVAVRPVGHALLTRTIYSSRLRTRVARPAVTALEQALRQHAG